MTVAGARGASTAGVTIGIYAAQLGMTQEEFKRHIYCVMRVGSIFSCRFINMCPYAAAANYLSGENCPQLDALDMWGPDYETWAMFSNMLLSTNSPITHELFSNTLHMDFDRSPYAYGLTILLRANGTPLKPEDMEDVRKNVKGSRLAFPTLGIAIALDRCGGIMEQFWPGPTLPHLTTQGTCSRDYRRWGTSAQISKDLHSRLNSFTSLARDEDRNLRPERMQTVNDIIKKLPRGEMSEKERELWSKEQYILEHESEEFFIAGYERLQVLLRGIPQDTPHEAPIQGMENLRL